LNAGRMFVRHPIYTGILLMILGTAIISAGAGVSDPDNLLPYLLAKTAARKALLTSIFLKPIPLTKHAPKPHPILF